MIVIPALDLRDGACVQLVGGSYADEPVRLPDPMAQLERWAHLGFRRLHLVDLDAATERGSNARTVETLLASCVRLGVEVQAGGGVREIGDIERLLAAGARWVLVGTRALEEPEWLADMASRFPDRLVLAADARGRRLVSRGWGRTLSRDVIAAVRAIQGLALAGLLVTAVHREGRLGGPDLLLSRAVAVATRLPVLASGGITTLEDLRSLAACRIAGAVVGMAFYTGALDPRAAMEEFAT